MDFIIFYEHLNRELENILLLKWELEKRGYSVAISHFNGCSYGRRVLFSRPKVVVTPWLRYDQNVYRYTRFKNRITKIVNLQWEQVYSQQGIDSGLVTIQGSASKAYHLCWGQKSRDRLLQQGISPDKLAITGAIQMDFAREKFAGYYKQRAELAQEFELKGAVPWVLYISSFAYAAYKPQDLKKLERSFHTSLAQLVAVAQESKKQTLDWIDQLLQANQELIFIYRPHPAENIDASLTALRQKHPHFRIISQYSVKQWIKSCDLINTWYSTAVAEVYFMGKNCHIIRPIPLPPELEVEIMRQATFITERDDFMALNSGRMEAPYSFPVPPAVIREYYDDDQRKPAYVRVADYLEKVYGSDAVEDYSLPAEESRKWRQQYRRMIIASLITDLIAQTRIPLSKYIPWRQKTWRYYEKWIQRLAIYREREKALLAYLRRCDHEK